MKKLFLILTLFLSFFCVSSNDNAANNFLCSTFSQDTYYSEKIKLTSTESDTFINHWNTMIATYGSVCDVPESAYRIILAEYNALSVDDKATVDAYVFEPSTNSTIKNGMDELTRIYRSANQSKKVGELDQNTTLIIVIVIALIGMTSICVFYSFKDNEIIK